MVGDLLKTGGQGAQPLGGTAHGHIPALVRGVGRVLTAHCIHTAAGQFLHPGRLALEQHGVGGQVPVEEDILRIFEEMLQEGVPQAGSRFGVSLCRTGRLRQDGEEGQGVALRPQVDIQLCRRFVNLLDRELARHDPLKKYAAGVLLVLLRLPVELGQVAPVSPLALNLFLQLLQHIQQRLFGDGLEEIAVHADADGLPGILEVVIAGDDDDFDLREFTADQFAEGQTVHKGHTDIGDQHVRLHLPDERQGHLSIPGLPGEGVAVPGPGDRVPQGLPDDALVLC